MNTRSSCKIATCTLIPLSLLSCNSSLQDERPNIIVIMTDDQGFYLCERGDSLRHSRGRRKP